MLNVHIGPLEGQIRYPSDYFNNQSDPEWFYDLFVIRICKEVDGTIVKAPFNMWNDIWGPVNFLTLSTGTKNLILTYKTNEIIYGTCMGDNCSDLLLEIADFKDITVVFEHLMNFNRDFTAHFLNDDSMTYTALDYIIKYSQLSYEQGESLR